MSVALYYSPAYLAANYLKLDCSNDPLTESLQLQKAGDNIHLYLDVYSTDNADYGRVYFQKSASNTAGAMVTTTDGDWLGNIKYLGVNDAGLFAGGGQMTVQQYGVAGTYVPTAMKWTTYSATGENANQVVLAPTSYVGLGTDTPAASLHVLNVEDNANVTIFNLEGKRPTPTNNDTMYIYYRMNNDVPASFEYARTTIKAEDITEDEEEGSLLFEVARGGTLEVCLKMSATEIVLNESGADRDLRVEASGQPNALLVNGADGVVSTGTNLTVGGDLTVNSRVAGTPLLLEGDGGITFYTYGAGAYFGFIGLAEQEGVLDFESLTADRIYTFPNVAGTVALKELSVQKVGDTMTGSLQINVPTTTSEALILKTTDDNATKNLFEAKDSSGTNLVEISGTGDMTFVGGAGLAFAEIYVKDSTATISLDADNADVKVTQFTTNGQSNNCTADAANDKITFTKIGKYLVTGSVVASIDVGNITTLEVSVYLNGSEQTNIHACRALASNAGNGSISLCGIIDVTTAGWDLDLRANVTDTTARDVIFRDLNLSVVQIGGT
jgi:hypothetical protein